MTIEEKKKFIKKSKVVNDVEFFEIIRDCSNKDIPIRKQSRIGKTYLGVFGIFKTGTISFNWRLIQLGTGIKMEEYNTIKDCIDICQRLFLLDIDWNFNVLEYYNSLPFLLKSEARQIAYSL